MKLPCEICIWEIVPQIKKALVKDLYKKGRRQIEIAKMLHLSKSSVSHYLNGRRANKSKDEMIIKIEKRSKNIDELSKKLINGTNYADLKDDFCNICKCVQKDTIKKALC